MRRKKPHGERNGTGEAVNYMHTGEDNELAGGND